MYLNVQLISWASQVFKKELEAIDGMVAVNG